MDKKYILILIDAKRFYVKDNTFLSEYGFLCKNFFEAKRLTFQETRIVMKNKEGYKFKKKKIIRR